MKFKLTQILVSDNKDLLIDKNKPGVVFKYERKRGVVLRKKITVNYKGYKINGVSAWYYKDSDYTSITVAGTAKILRELLKIMKSKGIINCKNYGLNLKLIQWVTIYQYFYTSLLEIL